MALEHYEQNRSKVTLHSRAISIQKYLMKSVSILHRLHSHAKSYHSTWAGWAGWAAWQLIVIIIFSFTFSSKKSQHSIIRHYTKY
jgi:hypothetical protein